MNSASKYRACIWGFQEFGLADLAALGALGKRHIIVNVGLRSPEGDLSALRRLKVQARRNWLRGYRERLLTRLLRNPHIQKGIRGVFRSPNGPTGFEATYPARYLVRLRRYPEVSTIRVTSAPGRAYRLRKQRKSKWYGVKLLIRIIQEFRVKGMDTWEESIVVVKARSHQDAARKAWKKLVTEAIPYLGTDLGVNRWVPVRILDVCEIMDLTFDPQGTEVFWSLVRKKFRRPAIRDELFGRIPHQPMYPDHFTILDRLDHHQRPRCK